MSTENEIQEDGRRKVAIDLEKANTFALYILVASILVLGAAYFLIWPGTFAKSTFKSLATMESVLSFFVAMLVGVVVHELIHGVTFACFAPSGLKSISFGVIWKMLTPYCHCNEPVSLRQYQLAAFMPCLVLGIIPAVVALCIPSLWLLLLAIFFIAAAAGDLWMMWLLTKEAPECRVLDHPSEAGFYLYPPRK